MLFENALWNSTMILIGEIAVLVVIFLVGMALFLLVVALLSIRNGRLYFPRIMKSWFFLLEGLVKGICRFFGLDDRDLISFSIRLQNSMNKKAFEAVPVEKRASARPAARPTSPPRGSPARAAASAPRARLSRSCAGWDTGYSSSRGRASSSVW
jgi:hypothetical protein